jgi:hypothetical protein
MSPEQEKKACDALVNLGWLENDHALHAEGLYAIRGALQCSTDEAKAALRELRIRNVIDTATTSEPLDPDKPAPLAKLRWIRPVKS